MSRGKELVKNTGILAVAKISTQIVSFLLLPLYTALLSTEEYGRVDIYTSLAMIVIPFLTLQIEMGLFRYYIASKGKTQKEYVISSSFTMIGGIMIIVSLLYGIFVAIVHLDYAILLYAYYLSLTSSTVMLQVCRACGDNVGYGIATFISSAFAVILNVLFIAILQWKVEGILLSTIIAQVTSTIFMLYRTKVFKYFSIRLVKKEQCKQLLDYSVPLVLNQIASWAINYSDRIIIVCFWGEGVNGIYSIANKFSNITNTFFGVYNTAWTENVVRNIEDKDSSDYISQIFTLTFNVYLILITGILNLLPFFFDIMVNSAFSEAYQHVPFLLVAMFFSGMAATLGSIYIAYNRTKEVSVTTMMAGICNVTIHYIMLNKFQLYAASVSTFVSFGLLYAYRYIVAKKFVSIKFSIRKVWLHIFALIWAWGGYASKNNIIIVSGFLYNLFCILLLLRNNRKLFDFILKKKK